MTKRRSSLATLSLLAALAGCAPPYVAPLGGQTALTANVENSDRVNRLARLSALNGISPPRVEQLTAFPGPGSGVVQPLPVVRVVFDERSMFASGSDQLQHGTGPALDILADSMRRDVPDAQLTLLGHTDASGSDALNDDLSLRRARAVFQALVNRGVNAGQLSTVAIGRHQPIAPNDTADGRARNRRVEVLISASMNANLAVVAQRMVDPAFLAYAAPAAAGPGRPAVRTADRNPVPQVAVMRTALYSGPADISEATPNGAVHLQPSGTLALGAMPETKS